jgi:hypothetical protein
VNSILIKVVGLALSLVLLGMALEWRLTLLEEVQDGVHGAASFEARLSAVDVAALIGIRGRRSAMRGALKLAYPSARNASMLRMTASRKAGLWPSGVATA